jgi:hypothetical protein
VDILQSKLAEHHLELAKEIKGLLIEAQNLGATSGVLKVELVCDQYDKVLPDVAYNWIDLNEFQDEIERVQSHTINSLPLGINASSYPKNTNKIIWPQA